MKKIRLLKPERTFDQPLLILQLRGSLNKDFTRSFLLAVWTEELMKELSIALENGEHYGQKSNDTWR